MGARSGAGAWASGEKQMTRQIQRVWSLLDSELWVITSAAGGRRGGLVATFVMNVSLIEAVPRVVVALARHHHTTQIIEQGRVAAFHLLSEEELSWVARFGMATGHELDKLAGVETREGETGCPILAKAKAWVEGKVIGKHDIGDRVLFTIHIVAGSVSAAFRPLTETRLREMSSEEERRRLDWLYERDCEKDAAALSHRLSPKEGS